MTNANTGALTRPTSKCLQRDRALELAHEGGNGDAEIEIGHHHAADDADHVGEEGKQRQRDHEPQHARQDENLRDVEPDRLHRVGLFVDAHGSDVSGEGGAGAARDDDGGDEAAQLAQEADAEEIDGVDLRVEALQLIGALIGEHDAEQEGEHAHDGQRA